MFHLGSCSVNFSLCSADVRNLSHPCPQLEIKRIDAGSKNKWNACIKLLHIVCTNELLEHLTWFLLINDKWSFLVMVLHYVMMIFGLIDSSASLGLIRYVLHAAGVCNHAFHFHCISRWLKTRQVRPLGSFSSSCVLFDLVIHSFEHGTLTNHTILHRQQWVGVPEIWPLEPGSPACAVGACFWLLLLQSKCFVCQTARSFAAFNACIYRPSIITGSASILGLYLDDSLRTIL